MRQIVLDTETTGLTTEDGHRIIEIGCIELIDRQITGKHFHHYLNPDREVEAGALQVHGITNEFLASKPSFATIVEDFLNFIKDAELIAHNATFDVGFINHEMQLLKYKTSLHDYVTIFDTLPFARKMYPGQRNSLDALCKRFKIDLCGRKLHGALLDANLLAEVYLLMTGGQINLFSGNDFAQPCATTKQIKTSISPRKAPLSIIKANPSELEQHAKFLTLVKNKSGKCLWEDLND